MDFYSSVKNLSKKYAENKQDIKETENKIILKDEQGSEVVTLSLGGKTLLMSVVVGEYENEANRVIDNLGY